MLSWLGGLGAILLGASVLIQVLFQVIPPHLWYFTRRKRRAMRLALEAFGREYPDSVAAWPGCRVYRADDEKCIVFVMLRSVVRPQTYAGYVVWHRRDQLDYLGAWQFHWGIEPRYAVEWYESRRAAAGGWWVGPIASICGVSDFGLSEGAVSAPASTPDKGQEWGSALEKAP